MNTARTYLIIYGAGCAAVAAGTCLGDDRLVRVGLAPCVLLTLLDLFGRGALAPGRPWQQQLDERERRDMERARRRTTIEFQGATLLLVIALLVISRGDTELSAAHVASLLIVLRGVLDFVPALHAASAAARAPALQD